MNDRNELLEELWKSRKEIEKENDNNIDKLYETYLQKQKQHPSDYYVGKPVPISKSKAA
jgi:hypothetical protein